MTDERRTTGKRSKRIYVLWGVALTLLIAAGLVCWKVVVPVWKTHRAVQICARPGDRVAMGQVDEAIAALGGRSEAPRHLARYLRFPKWMAPHRLAASIMLCQCGEEAFPEMIDLLRHQDPAMRSVAAESLGQLGSSRARAALEIALLDPDKGVRQAAREALEEIRAVERKDVLFIVASKGYRKVPPGEAAHKLRTWLENIMQRSNSPKAPPAGSPWRPEYMIWEHVGSQARRPSRCFVIAANGYDMFLGDNHNPRKPIKASEMRSFNRIMEESGIKVQKYEVKRVQR